MINDNRNEGTGANAGISYSPMISYNPAAMSSMPDLGYFRAALEMKARHAGLTLVSAEPEAVLFVLVDVLGTNRSHTDQILMSNDRLLATCELTYYAQDMKTGTLIFAARRASSAASYQETHQLGVTGPAIERTLVRIPPTPLPVDDEQKPTTRPAADPAASSIAKRKPLINDLINRMAGTNE